MSFSLKSLFIDTTTLNAQILISTDMQENHYEKPLELEINDKEKDNTW